MDEKLTRFEVARIIGVRALQISMGAPLMVKVPKDENNVLELAKLEFEKNMIPITVRRLVGEEPVEQPTEEETPAVVPEFEEEDFEESEEPAESEEAFVEES